MQLERKRQKWETLKMKSTGTDNSVESREKTEARVFTQEGQRIYYTDDHYESFTLLYGEE